MIAVVLALALGLPPEGGNDGVEPQAPPRDTRAAPGRAGASLSGIVTTDEPQPRPLRRARVTLNGEALSGGRTIVTGDDGSFAFDGLPAGAYELRAEKDAYVAMSLGAMRPGSRGTPVTLAPGAGTSVAIRLPRGAVVTGTVLDVDGQPAQGVTVTALVRRFHGASGEWRYADADAPSLPTDDRGVYRIFGLPAGEYVISAQPGESNGPAAVNARPMRTMGEDAPGRRAFMTAQVFAPSATDVARASRVAVRAGEERSGVDVQLQYVPLASVSGAAAAPAGWSQAEVVLVDVGDTRGSTVSRTTRADESGRFSFAGVTPGQYRIGARSTGPIGAMSIAMGDVTIDGDDVENVTLSLQPALTVGGLIVFRGDSRPPVLGTSTTTPVPLAILLSGAAPTRSLQVDGVRFTIDGLPEGPFRMSGNLLGVQRPLGGWWLQSIVANGVELLDTPLDVRQNVHDAIATFADRASEISGRVTSADGTPLAGATVVAFSPDRAAWFTWSRRIVGASVDRDARYTIRNLPPGEYRLAVAWDVEPLEWFDPAVLERLLPRATAVTIAGAGTVTRDLIVR